MEDRTEKMPEVRRGRKARKESTPEIESVDRLKESIEEIDRLCSDGRPYDEDMAVREMCFFYKQVAGNTLNMGKTALWIKGHSGHGRFLQILEREDMSIRYTQYAIRAFRKFSNTNMGSHLEMSKMRVLSVLDDDDIQALDEGEEVYGLTLDSIGNMTTRELRTALREARQKLTQKEETIESIIRQKNSKIDELEIKLSGQEPPTKAQLAEARLRKEIDPVFFQKFLAATHQIRECTRLIEEAQKIEGITFDVLDAWTRLNNEYLANFTNVFEEFNDVYENIHVDRSRDREEDGV